jgi:hypothetical protein
MIMLVLAVVMLPAAIHAPTDPIGMCIQQSCDECGFGNTNGSSASCACVESDLSLPAKSIIRQLGALRECRKLPAVSDLEKPDLTFTNTPVINTPLEFLTGWQFMRRAALLPRDPTSAS